MLYMDFTVVSRGEIFQHRFSGEEGDGDRKCDPLRSTHKHFKGEESTILAIISTIIVVVIIIVSFLINEENKYTLNKLDYSGVRN